MADAGNSNRCERILAKLREGIPKKELLELYEDWGKTYDNLKNLGFVQIDALDPSKGMMAEAEKRGICQKCILVYMTENPVPGLKQDSYDVVVGLGMVGYTHVPYTSMIEMLRLTKPGGYVMLSIIASCPTFTELKGMEPTMERLEKEGK